MIELIDTTCPICGNTEATVDVQDNPFACAVHCDKCGYVRDSES